MRKIFIIVLVFLVSGCQETLVSSADEMENSVMTKSTEIENEMFFDFKIEDLDSHFFVTQKDIEKYVKFVSLRDKKEKNIVTIEPFDIHSAVVFYVVNYDNGWEIISADKRTPMILGHSNVGAFSMKNYEKYPWGTWMLSVGYDVLKTRLYGDKSITVNTNETYMLWTSITEPDILFAPPLIPDPEVLPEGHWELMDTFVLNSNCDTLEVRPLIETKWEQENGFNCFCPYKTDNSGKRAPVGCVAVSGGQMMRYLHYKLGRPSNIPSYAYCSGFVGNYSWAWGGSTNTTWDDMSFPKIC